MMEQIRKKRMEYQDKICLSTLEEKELEIIKAIYFSQQFDGLTGDEAKNLFRKIKQAELKTESLRAHLLSKFQSQLEKISTGLLNLEKELLE